MKKILWIFISLLFVLSNAAIVFAQHDSSGTQQIAIPLTHPDKPGKLKVELIQGSINVESYAGKTVIIHYQADNILGLGSDQNQKPPKGMKMIQNHSFGLDARESDNTVTINSSSPLRKLDLTIQVPADFSLDLSTISGDITIKQINGNMDLKNVNGDITMQDVSGSANANTINGKITADFRQINENVPMAFTTLNGNVDVTLPAKAKFTAKMKTDRGNIYTGFNMDLTGNNQPKVETKSGNNVFQVSVNNWQYGEVNGGGTEILFKSFNGSLYIRKK